MTIAAPSAASLKALLRLGVPMGLAVMVEVTGFTFMAFFVSRIGATAVAGHQIAVNMVSMMFMLPLAIANASSTLVAQQVGAGDSADARRIGWAGLEIGVGVAAVVGGAVYFLREQVVGLYTANPVIVAAALPLLAWVALFHVADAAQTVAAFVLRAYRIATLPLLIYVVALWGVGLGGGYLAAFDPAGISPAWMHSARGFWSMATLGLTVAAVSLTALLAWKLRGDAGKAAPKEPAPPSRREEGCGGSNPEGGLRLKRQPSAAGISITNRLPPPARASQRTLPPWRSAICLTRAQAEADAAGLLGMAGQAKERLEDALAHRLGNAGAAVADLERDEVARRAP